MSNPLERRVIAPGDLRASGDAIRRITGHAAVFNKWTTLVETKSFVWREMIRPGAFKAAIAERQDVRALWNHDANYVLGRTTSGTLRLREDAIGLLTETDAPETQIVHDLVLAPIARGDVSQMSFAFSLRSPGKITTTESNGVHITTTASERVSVKRDGNRIIEERELLSVDLWDISPVTFPAYKDTKVALMSHAAAREERDREILNSVRRSPNRNDAKDQLRWMRMRLLDVRLKAGAR